ncbi:hypothetical protein KIN20_012029 [Parelaphostrongylus tenuis]|uniref:Uncharacterized protein n=1 Tax=Parelaphostrongylus tenuis TaxID=148309 RepID=A0AAD5MAA8_PARTN|nr:hypothetical protein KIN20_012029 [Parelaphostrongylus tenuis]
MSNHFFNGYGMGSHNLKHNEIATDGFFVVFNVMECSDTEQNKENNFAFAATDKS